MHHKAKNLVITTLKVLIIQRCETEENASCLLDLKLSEFIFKSPTSQYIKAIGLCTKYELDSFESAQQSKAAQCDPSKEATQHKAGNLGNDVN